MRRIFLAALLLATALALETRAPALAAAAPDLVPSPLAAAPHSAVVLESVATLFSRPFETSEPDDQAVLGDHVEVVEETTGYTRVTTRSGVTAWIPARSLRRDPPLPSGAAYEVGSSLAHVYRDPDFTTARPLLSAPMGARLEVLRTFARKGHDWAEIRLPDGRRAFAALADLSPAPAERTPVLDPSSWLALGKRFLGAPYTWGGTTPAGFDCSGLLWRIFERHGIVLKRNSSQMCFREPQLVPVRFDQLRAGDLVFFGTSDSIDHTGMWVGDGTVLQATAFGVPSTQVTQWGNERLSERFRYARRLASLPGAPRPSGLDAAKSADLGRRLAELSKDGVARYGIVFEDLTSGARIAVGEREVMHAASTMKTPVMLEVLRRVDDGTLDWELPITVKNEFRSVVDGSKFTCEPEGEADADVVPLLGKTAPLSLLVRAMITRSSNIAANLVLELVGAERVQALADRIGAPTVRVRRGVSDLKAFEAGISNETDAAGMAAVMKAAVRSPLLTEASRRRAFEILAAQVWNEQIPAGIPRQAGAVVAHKTGSISTVQHDAAVVRLPDGREYILVLLADGFKGEAAREKVYETTRKMSRTVWDAMIVP